MPLRPSVVGAVQAISCRKRQQYGRKRAGPSQIILPFSRVPRNEIPQMCSSEVPKNADRTDGNAQPPKARLEL